MLEQGVGDRTSKLPTLLVLNKKDLIKPGEVAKKIEVYSSHFCFVLCCEPTFAGLYHLGNLIVVISSDIVTKARLVNIMKFVMKTWFGLVTSECRLCSVLGMCS